MAKKILVVDDELHTVKYLETLLQDNGYETCAAPDGEEAADILRKEKPDLITLDLQMPHERGTKFYEKLRKDDEFGDIPIVVISGLAAPHRAIKKAVASLSKPFDPEELIEIITKAIGPGDAA